MRTRRLIPVLVAALALLATSLVARSSALPSGVWLAGDLHVHTTHSHDVCSSPPTDEHCDPDGDGDPSDPYTWGFTPGEQIANAEARGLDFLALTDHNTVAQQSDEGYRSDRLTLIPAYENSLRAHAQMLGASRLYPGAHETAAQVQLIADALRADGGAFQINHPGDGGFSTGSWERRYGHALVPDSVEVWNVGPWIWQPPFPSANDNDRAVRFWEGFLDRGHRVAATGGSDNHWRSTSAAQGVGQPTTWVYAADDSPASILEAIKLGRTTISMNPPALGGARIYLEALDGDDPVAMVGDTVARGSTFRVRVVGAPGAYVRVVGSGGALVFGGVVDLPDFTATFRIPGSVSTSWIRAETFAPDSREPRTAVCPPQAGSYTTYCKNRLAMLAMTSAMFLS